jgi:hypothetical protein
LSTGCQVGRGPVRVSLTPLSRLQIGCGQSGQFACIVPREQRHGVLPLGPHELDVAQGHSQQCVLRDCGTFEAAAVDLLPTDEIVENGLRHVAGEYDAGNLHRASPNRPCARADVQGVAIDVEDRSIRLLQHASMRIEVRAGIERRQKLGCRELTQRHRLEHALLRQEDLRVLYAGQPQRARQIDRREVRLQILLQQLVVSRHRKRGCGEPAARNPNDEGNPQHEEPRGMEVSRLPAARRGKAITCSALEGFAFLTWHFRRHSCFGFRAFGTAAYFGTRIWAGGCRTSSGTCRASVSAGGAPSATYN